MGWHPEHFNRWFTCENLGLSLYLLTVGSEADINKPISGTLGWWSCTFRWRHHKPPSSGAHNAVASTFEWNNWNFDGWKLPWHSFGSCSYWSLLSNPFPELVWGSGKVCWCVGWKVILWKILLTTIQFQVYQMNFSFSVRTAKYKKKMFRMLGLCCCLNTG